VTPTDGAGTARRDSHGQTPLGLAAVGLLAATVYVVTVGGTGSGELSPMLRLINAGIAASLIVTLIVRAPGEADRLDQVTIVALALFAIAGAFSMFPRQSFDAVLAATAYTAGLFLARRALARDTARRTLMQLLMGLSAAFTLGTAVVWIPHFLEWWALTNWTTSPRLDLPFASGPWGYRYDVVLLIALLYPAWWTGRVSPARRVSAIAIGLLGLTLVVLSGSRTMWLSLVIASVAVAAPVAWIGWRRHRTAVGWAVAVGAILTTAVLLSEASRPFLERGLTLGTIAARLAMWGPLTELWLSHPLAGVGPGSFPWALQLTPYFDTNSFAPRHPDSPVIQLLVEGGLIGLTAASIVIASVAAAVVRGRSRAAAWALIVAVVACLGTNPTDFAFLVVVLIAWTAYAAPSKPAVAGSSALRRMPVMAGLAVMAVISAAYGATLVGGFAYDAARAAVDRDDLRGAKSSLDVAVAVDPGMALYWRQRGIASRLLGNDVVALPDLARATELNPVDDLAWRATAFVHSSLGDTSAAMRAIERAVAVQRSDAANLLSAAWLLRRNAQDEEAEAVLAEVAQAWPLVVGAANWSTVAPPGQTVAILQAAAARWAGGMPAPQRYEGQDDWLALILADPTASDEAGESTLPRAISAARRCDPQAANLLKMVSSAERGTVEYWEARARVAANGGERDDDAVTGFYLSTGTPVVAQRTDATLNPLNEGAWWGYRRTPIFWPSTEPVLPDPHAGWLRWVFAPQEAIAEAQLEAQLPACLPDTGSPGSP